MENIADAVGDGVRLAEIPDSLARHPAFAPYLDLVPFAIDANGAAGAGDGRAAPPPRFVPPPSRALGALEFERRLVDRSELIVRPDNLHDTINALVWHRFPHSKRAISEVHVALGAANTANGRPRRRDILTLFDEAGALIISQREDLRALHEAHEWRRLFIDHRADFLRHCRTLLFGHGTLEQLASNPHRGLTVKALWLNLPPDTALAEVDWRFAEQIRRDEVLHAKERRLALPILGVPGWFDENRSPACYDDVEVFRPARPLR